MPKMIVSRHCCGVSFQVCPIHRAIRTAMVPAIRNRTDDTVSGGALVTIIRAEVKADDHMNANASPATIALKSMTLPLADGIA